MATMAPIRMFTTTWCGHCRRLKRQMTEAGLTFEEVDLDEDPSHDDRILAAAGGHRVVPTLEVGGRLLVNPTIAEVTSAASAV
jgi:mycoredoxin